MNKTPLVIILLLIAAVAAGGWYKYFDASRLASEATNRADKLAADYEKSQQSLNETMKQLASVRSEIDGIRTQAAHLQVSSQDLERTREELRKAHLRFEAARTDFESRMEQMQADWDKERADWQARTGQWDAERTQWDAERAQWDAERAQWEAERTEWQREREELQADLDAQRRTADARIKQLTQDLATAQGSERTTRGELERLRAMVVKLGEHETMVKQLSAQLKTRDTDLSQMEARIAEMEQAAAEEKARFARLRENLQTELASREVQLEQLEDKRTMIRVGSDILFETGSAELTADGMQTLNLVARILREYPQREINVEGHTDNVPIGPELAQLYPSNWELSAARAARAVRYLQSAGVDGARLNVVGHGAAQPVTDNEDAEARARNRRIEIAVLPQEDYKVVTRQ